MESSVYVYKIPEEILRQITDELLVMFYSELTSVFGDIDLNELQFLTSTNGWCEGFCNSCKVLNCNDILEYYLGLEWYNADYFDDEICNLLEKKLYST